jgi:hypothetical protein
MNKLPECDRCQFYARSSYAVCAIHPYGVEEENCLDFREYLNFLLGSLQSILIKPSWLKTTWEAFNLLIQKKYGIKIREYSLLLSFPFL